MGQRARESAGPCIALATGLSVPAPPCTLLRPHPVQADGTGLGPGSLLPASGRADPPGQQQLQDLGPGSVVTRAAHQAILPLLINRCSSLLFGT